MSIQERMVQILNELPAIGKDQRNPQQGFMFRGHDDILNALNPLLAKHGVIIVPDVVERVTAQRTTQKGGTMYEVNLHVRFTFWGQDGPDDYLEASTWGEGTDTGDKATNKAMTMAFKNVLNQAFAISSAEFKDADAETPEETQGRRQAPSDGDAPSPQGARSASPSEGAWQASSEGDGGAGGSGPPGLSPSEDGSGFKPPPSAAEKSATKGTRGLLKAHVESLQKGFPSPDPTHDYWDDVQAFAYELTGKASSSTWTEAEAQQIVREFENRLLKAQHNQDVPIS